MYRFLRFLALVLTKVWFRLRRSGGENIPESGAAILVCNHIHLMDVACTMAMTRRQVYFMAKKELFEGAFLRWVLSSIGTFPISRGDADLSGIRTALRIVKEGKLLCIFPEGTRNRDAKQPLLPLQEGVAMISLRAHSPIVPMWVQGGYVPWKPCSLTVGAPMDLSEYQDVKRIDSAVMKKLTGQMRDALLDCREKSLKK